MSLPSTNRGRSGEVGGCVGQLSAVRGVGEVSRLVCVERRRRPSSSRRQHVGALAGTEPEHSARARQRHGVSTAPSYSFGIAWVYPLYLFCISFTGESRGSVTEFPLLHSCARAAVALGAQTRPSPQCSRSGWPFSPYADLNCLPTRAQGAPAGAPACCRLEACRSRSRRDAGVPASEV
jgi:hypothetical protein